jgi:hypothetical protein
VKSVCTSRFSLALLIHVCDDEEAQFGQFETFDINYRIVDNLYGPRFSKHQDCEDVGR